jgi:flagellar protein FlaJ
MKTFQAMGARWMRLVSPVALTGARHAATAKALRAARMRTFPEWYVSLSYTVAAGSALVAGVAAWLLSALLPPPASETLRRAVFAGGLSLLAFTLVRLGFLVYPRLSAAGRAKRIDRELPSIIVLCYALARGGLNAVDIFRAVRDERETYGEASVEFGIVVRDVEWLGHDLVSALQHAADTTPSATLRGFFEGLISILNSGADPQSYFKHQAEAQLAQGEMHLEKDLEQAGLLAEVYVSGLLVLPLLLIVVLSGLAPLGGGGESFIPIITFALIPLGTLVYLLMLETLMPADAHLVPKVEPSPLADFGTDSVPTRSVVLPAPWRMGARDLGVGEGPHALARARWLRIRVFAERMSQRLQAAWRRFFTRMVSKPLDALEFSGFIGLGIAGIGGGLAWSQGMRGEPLAVFATGLLLAAALCTVLPVSVFHEMRVRRARKVEKGLPDALGKLAGFNDRGIGLLQSFMILGKSSSGPLAVELRAVEKDVSWNGNLGGALRRLRLRVNTVTMAKLGILLERASRATSNLKDVLAIAATDAAKTEGLRARRRQAMVSYVIVVYIVFAVFLYVVYMVADLFYGPSGLGAAAAASTSGGLSAGLDARSAKLLFMQASIVQGACCGLVAGRLGEGHVLSGLKHAVFMGVTAWLVFVLGVL